MDMPLAVKREECYFWDTHGGVEIDRVLRKDGKVMGVCLDDLQWEFGDQSVS
jgi:hypothetical protein